MITQPKNAFKLLFRIIFLGLTASCFFALDASDSSNPSKSEVFAKYLKTPLSFESNMGQTDARVKYLTSGPSYRMFFTPDAIVIALKSKSKDKPSSPLSMTFINSNPNVAITGEESQKNLSNYFKGKDPKKWHSNIPNFAKVRYQNLYSGIDAVFYGNPQHLEYDLCVSPGSSPDNIRLHIEGSQKINLSDNGDLRILTQDDQELVMQKPFIYQIVDGNKVTIEGHYTLFANNDVGFSLSHYDTTKSVVIDPVLLYSTYLGGSNSDNGFGVAVDTNNNVYVVGFTSSTDFPTLNAFQSTFSGAVDAFVTKFARTDPPQDYVLSYSTYLGGSGVSGSDQAFDVAVDASGSAYVTGFTTATDFPTMNPFQGTLLGFQNAFVTKFSPSGSTLIYSTYLGGNNATSGNGITVDSAGNAYVTGNTQSTNFPTTPGAFQSAPGAGTQGAAFVTKFSPAGNTLVYSTYLGGTGLFTFTSGDEIAIDSLGNAYVTGSTNQSTFPTTPGAFQTIFTGGGDAYLTKFAPSGNTLVFSTFLGGSTTTGSFGVAVDSSFNPYIAGFTDSPDFPTTPGAFQTTIGTVLGVPSINGFVTKFSVAGDSLVYSTYLGGSITSFGGNCSDECFGIAVDSTGAAYVTGQTDSVDFPLQDAFQTTNTGILNAFVTKLVPTGTALVYSSYLGGSNFDSSDTLAIDSFGNAYVVGFTSSTDFPTVNPFQSSLNGQSDAFLSIIGDALPPPPPPPPPPGPTILPPNHLRAHKIVNQFLNVTEFIVLLKWDPPSQGEPPVKYLIFRNSLDHQIGSVPATHRLRFTDYTLKEDKTYIYYIISVDQFGNRSTPATIGVRFNGSS